MKVLSSIVMVLAIVGLTGVAALAQNGPTPAPKARPLYGVVVKVSDDGKTVTVESGRGDNAKEVAVAVDDKTVVTVDGKDAKVTDLKAGMHVVVTPAEGTATKIVAKTPDATKDGGAPKAGGGN